MRLKKLLVVPGERLAAGGGSGPIWRKGLGQARRKFGWGPIVHEGELQYIGDIPRVMGKDNVFYVGGEIDGRLTQTPEPGCPYPSCHGVTRGSAAKLADLPKTVGMVDAVLVSAAGGELARRVITWARKKDKLVAILDRLDHSELYGSDNQVVDMYRGYLPGDDFDIYFKQDLLPHLVSDVNLPISPLPVRPESFSQRDLPKRTTVFYSGRPRYNISQLDKRVIIEAVLANIPNTDIILHSDRTSFLSSQQYVDHLTQAFMALSPSCRVWDSFRHCEVGLVSNTALVAPKPYMAICGPPMKDGENAILYRTRLGKEGKYKMDDPDIIERIKYYLNHPVLLEKIARRWHSDVLKGHTVEARSKYIIDQIDKALA